MVVDKKLLLYYLPIIGLLILINIILSTSSVGNGHDLEGNIVLANSFEMKKAIIKTMLFTIQFFGFLIGLLVSFLPYKGLKYWQKYLKASLLCIVGIHIIVFCASIYNIFIR